MYIKLMTISYGVSAFMFTTTMIALAPAPHATSRAAARNSGAPVLVDHFTGVFRESPPQCCTSWLERLPWAQEVPSSNLGAPTKLFIYLAERSISLSDLLCPFLCPLLVRWRRQVDR